MEDVEEVGEDEEVSKDDELKSLESSKEHPRRKYLGSVLAHFAVFREQPFHGRLCTLATGGEHFL